MVRLHREPTESGFRVCAWSNYTVTPISALPDSSPTAAATTLGMGSRYRDRPQMRTDRNVKICEGRNSTRRSSRAPPPPPPPHFREKGLAALGSIWNQASLLDRNARSAGSEGQPSALHFMGNSQEWRLLILMSGPLEAGKRLCWKLFEERMRVSGGGGTEMRAQRGYGRDRCRGGEPEKRRLLPRGHFYITDCMTGTFKSPGSHRCIPGAPNTSLVQNLIPQQSPTV